LASLEVFIGAPIEHASERATLRRVYEFLSAQGIPAVILANVTLGNRQLDLVIAIDGASLVTESKGFTSAVRGGHNGDWKTRLASGAWKKIANPYLQALSQKLALRDAMRSFAGAEVPYPAGFERPDLGQNRLAHLLSPSTRATAPLWRPRS